MAVDLIIIGAGPHGRSTLEIVKACNATAMQFRVSGYLDDDPTKRVVDGIPVLGRVDWLETHHRKDLRYVIAVADCADKERVASRLEPFELSYVSIVHPSVLLSSGVELRAGCIVGGGVVIAHDTTIGEHVTVNLNSTIGHDCAVGRFTTIAPGANVAGRVHIGQACDIGLNAGIAKGVRVEDGSVVGPGAIVVKDVAAGQRVFGNPARVVPVTPIGSGQQVRKETT